METYYLERVRNRNSDSAHRKLKALFAIFLFDQTIAITFVSKAANF